MTKDAEQNFSVTVYCQITLLLYLQNIFNVYLLLSPKGHYYYNGARRPALACASAAILEKYEQIEKGVGLNCAQ